MQLSKLAHKYTCYIVLAFELYIFLIRLNIFRVIYVTCGVHKIIDGSVQCGRVEIVKQEKLQFTGCLRKYLWKFRYRLVVVLWVQMCMYLGHDCLKALMHEIMHYSVLQRTTPGCCRNFHRYLRKRACELELFLLTISME